jgi:hypothetical protein
MRRPGRLIHIAPRLLFHDCGGAGRGVEFGRLGGAGELDTAARSEVKERVGPERSPPSAAWTVPFHLLSRTHACEARGRWGSRADPQAPAVRHLANAEAGGGAGYGARAFGASGIVASAIMRLLCGARSRSGVGLERNPLAAALTTPSCWIRGG